MMFNRKYTPSDYNSIENSYKRVAKRKQKIRKIIKLICDPNIIAHLASILTIAGIYFSYKSWHFDVKRLSDWIIIVICFIVFCRGFWYLKTNLKKEIEMTVTFKELQDLLTVARYEAQNSIINIGGDISWLKEDLDSIRKIKKDHMDIKITIHYDKHRLSNSTKELIGEVRKEGILELIPYPEGITPPNIRCMITDYKFSESNNCKIYTYSKIASSNNNDRQDDKFEWKENTIDNNNYLYEVITSFIDTLERSGKRRILVGVTGLNNTGKTSIINECHKILGENFNVKIVPDTFYLYPNAMNSNKTNKQIIFHQVNELIKYNDYDIVFFDRTPFDNFIYLIMREYMSNKKSRKNISSIMSEYNNLVIGLMSCFNLVYYIERRNENESISTRFVSPNERKCLRNLYDRYYSKYINAKTTYDIRGGEHFVEDVKATAESMAEQIQSYYYL